MKQPDPLMHSAIFRPETREEIERNACQYWELHCNRMEAHIDGLEAELNTVEAERDGAMQIAKEYADALEEELRKRK